MHFGARDSSFLALQIHIVPTSFIKKKFYDILLLSRSASCLQVSGNLLLGCPSMWLGHLRDRKRHIFHCSRCPLVRGTFTLYNSLYFEGSLEAGTTIYRNDVSYTYFIPLHVKKIIIHHYSSNICSTILNSPS